MHCIVHLAWLSRRRCVEQLFDKILLPESAEFGDDRHQLWYSICCLRAPLRASWVSCRVLLSKALARSVTLFLHSTFVKAEYCARTFMILSVGNSTKDRNAPVQDHRLLP
ncbi:hypothetical protein LTR17_009954 [Elasticomyces elasticus]|nr:hypothetical protein LTR17_009954 [Elasticomyces elasticus]